MIRKSKLNKQKVNTIINDENQTKLKTTIINTTDKIQIRLIEIQHTFKRQ